jgi:hypothetical protein
VLAEEVSGDKIQTELLRLRRLAALVFVVLVIWIVAMLALAVGLLDREIAGEPGFAILALAGGALGSAVSAVVSAAGRVANGWELSDGKKLPPDDPERPPKDMFVAKMAPFFLLRPFLGAATGFLVYVGIVGGVLIAATEPPRPGENLDPYGVLFLSTLGGIFAKTFLEHLRAAFDALFGK